MKLLYKLIRWLDVRPGEGRIVGLRIAGAFLSMAFLVLGKSLSEALYLTNFDIKTLPYMMAAVALLSIPVVSVFSRLLSIHTPLKVTRFLTLVLASGTALFWPLVPHVKAAIVVFFLWISLGTLLVTSGFWLITSELFPLRGAKRLYGLIGAGGTLGAMATGNSLNWFSKKVDLLWLFPGLILLLSLFFLTQRLMPVNKSFASHPVAESGQTRSSAKERLGLIWRNAHLRGIALIVFTASMASTLLDYQFKERAAFAFPEGETLAGFFGAFYGWTGAIALFVQLIVTARLLSSSGISVALAVLPVMLLFGSAGLLALPSLVVATLVRGADTTMRKSLYRSVVEVLFVPVPSMARRKTKAFIDSIVDSLAEGCGAAVVLLFVTVLALPSRMLSVPVILLAVVFLFLSHRMRGHYLDTVTDQLEEGSARATDKAMKAGFEGVDLLSASFSFSKLEVHSVLEEAGLLAFSQERTGQQGGSPATNGAEDPGDDILTVLGQPDSYRLIQVLDEFSDWNAEHVQALIRLLVRENLLDKTVPVLAALGDVALPHLAASLSDERTDFVIRRRLPRVLAQIDQAGADDALLEALAANRFEVRYRAAIALLQRRKAGLRTSRGDWKSVVWGAVRAEVGRERALWELNRLLDAAEGGTDDFVIKRAGLRGELSLEHTFRLLTLVLEPQPVRAAFHGILVHDDNLKSLALEYLEHVLPPDIRERLWPFIGDVSEHQKRQATRPLHQVVAALVLTNETLFASESEREALRRMLDRDEPGS